jgi:hypothetical protein
MEKLIISQVRTHGGIDMGAPPKNVPIFVPGIHFLSNKHQDREIAKSRSKFNVF